MSRQSLIRHVAGFAFVLLFGGGLVLGGSAALAGIPKLLDAVTPDMAAQAGVRPGQNRLQDVARFEIPEGFAQSRVAPQVLYPITARPKPDWLIGRMARNASSVQRETRPVIAICIDDMGEDLAGTDKAMALPKEVALSFLPYADATPFLAEAAKGRGHLVLAHVPMQALNGADPGPMGLKPGMTAVEITGLLNWNLARVPGLVGINNHEGSRFTADRQMLAPVMARLGARHLFFFDSRTGPESAVGDAARAAGVMSAARDVFLDDDPSPAAVSAELEKVAREAKRSGVAIAIGHPHDVTLKLLTAWLAQDHGVSLVPLDQAIRMKAEREYFLAHTETSVLRRSFSR
ncbi:MAG TPA: divergent polysaccharide deacetylase family protein [Rhizomicrobium sp.]|nr:divergent polysaccharide deacetylase family protein [Rhizomicrobium sp.]